MAGINATTNKSFLGIGGKISSNIIYTPARIHLRLYYFERESSLKKEYSIDFPTLFLHIFYFINMSWHCKFLHLYLLLETLQNYVI